MEKSTRERDIKFLPQKGHLFRARLPRRLPYFLDPISRIGEHPIRILEPYIKNGNWIADLGCGWGYYSFLLADMVGSNGKVFAVDLADKCIQSIQKKIAKKGIHNIEAHTASAAHLDFISDQTIDLVFANGLLCSMEQDRQLAVAEMKRILRSTGKAFLTVGTPAIMSYVDDAEWQEILQSFKIKASAPNNRVWSIVAVKPDT